MAETHASIISETHRTPDAVAIRDSLLAKRRARVHLGAPLQLDPAPPQKDFFIPQDEEGGQEETEETPVKLAKSRIARGKLRKGTPLMPKRTVGGLREFLVLLLNQKSKPEKVTLHSDTGDMHFTVMDCAYNEGAFFFLFHKDEFTFNPKLMAEFEITFRENRQTVFFPGVNFCFDGWPYYAIILIAKPS